MRVVSVTPTLAVVARDAAPAVPMGQLFSGYGGRKIWVCSRILVRLARYSWIPRFLAGIPLRLCSAEIAEALLARDPEAFDADGVRWGRGLRRILRKAHSWRWLEPGGSSVRESPTVSAGPGEPLVSIVLPTYNGVRYLSESIRSCLDQTYRNLELLVVDDGSTADVRGIVAQFSDARLRYLRHDRNQGIAAGLNTGFRNSRGEYLTWTSDDNWYAKGAIEILLRFLQRYPEVDMVYSECDIVDDNGAVTGRLEQGPPASLRDNNYIGACFLYKRSLYERVGDYRTLYLVEDYDYWIRAARVCRLQRLMTPLYYYRMHPDSLTARHSSDEVYEQARQAKSLNRIG